MDKNQPLWMPEGSVQSIAFLTLVLAVIVADLYSTVSVGSKPEIIRDLVLMAAAVYWAKRTGDGK